MKAQLDITTEKTRGEKGLSCIICRTTYKGVEYKRAYAYYGSLREARSKFRAYVLAEDAKCIWNEPATAYNHFLTKNPMAKFKVGDKVLHPEFGECEIMRIWEITERYTEQAYSLFSDLIGIRWERLWAYESELTLLTPEHMTPTPLPASPTTTF